MLFRHKEFCGVKALSCYGFKCIAGGFSADLSDLVRTDYFFTLRSQRRAVFSLVKIRVGIGSLLK
jgi:hypothetical protein